jgi:putative transposase
VIVSPATVVGWHRQGFRLWWRWKSRGRPGRPRIDPELRRLIRRLSHENPLWGAPRIQAELRLLGCDVAESTVAKYRMRPTRPPSPTWRSFLANHVNCLASVDFFVVPTATFRLLYGFLVLRHDRRLVAHFNVTAHPTADWVARQIREAFPFDEAPRYLMRDRDGCGSRKPRRPAGSTQKEPLSASPIKRVTITFTARKERRPFGTDRRGRAPGR